MTDANPFLCHLLLRNLSEIEKKKRNAIRKTNGHGSDDDDHHFESEKVRDNRHDDDIAVAPPAASVPVGLQ